MTKRRIAPGSEGFTRPRAATSTGVSAQLATRWRSDRSYALGRLGRRRRSSLPFDEVKRLQVRNVGIRCPLRQFGEHVKRVGIRLDVACATREHEAVDRRACLRASDRVTEQPGLAACAERPDVALDNVMPTPRLCRVMHARDGGYGLL